MVAPDIRTHIYQIIDGWRYCNVWKYIELRIDPDSFGTSFHIYSMNKKDSSKNPLNPKAHFKWVFMDII